MKQQYQINYSALTIPTTSNAKSPLEQKKKALVLSAFVRWRRSGDLNPGWSKAPLLVFETNPFNRLGTSPRQGVYYHYLKTLTIVKKSKINEK